MRFSLFFTMALTLGACASGGSMDDPVFKAGYDAGCTAAHSAYAAREAMTAGKPDLYKHGFSAGFTSCGGGQEQRR
jgi:hypothetical protein